MKKVFFIGVMLVVASNSMATEYCYDRGVIDVYRTQERLLKCDPSIDTSQFVTLVNRFEKWNLVAVATGAYPRRILKEFGDLYEVYYLTLPYGETTKNNPCVHEEIKKFPDLKAAVMDSIISCSF